MECLVQKYRIVVAGGRDFHDRKTAFRILDQLLVLGKDNIEVVCGEARGADTIGKEWAIENDIQVASFPADWKNNGKAAGPIRNREMAEYGTILIAFYDGKSRGTANMIKEADKRNLDVYVHRY